MISRVPEKETLVLTKVWWTLFGAVWLSISLVFNDILASSWDRKTLPSVPGYCIKILRNLSAIIKSVFFQELWFQQDGATCHTARATIDLLKDTLGDRLISRFGPVNWPQRSCDLTPLDYFLWGYVKSLVYADKPQTLDHLEDNIRRVIANIRPQMLEKVIENWTSRLDYIRGSPMPEIIFKIGNRNFYYFIYERDGSKGEINTTGSGVLIELPGRVIKFQRRNADHASVFRTELIAIVCGLSFINNIRDLAFSEIWILTDSRSSNIYRIGHLSATAPARSILHPFSLSLSLSNSFWIRQPVHLQWVPSHVGLLGNEVADDLAKAATSNPVDPEDHMVLTSTEIFCRAKELICRTWVVSPVHPWYFQRHPGSAISFKGSRSYQTAFSRFLTRHLRCMNFEGGKRSFPICPKCNINPFSPQRILQCLGFSCEEAVASPCCS
ncbi:RNase H domain-containing protein [Trichonephila clavipes]|nr:RNase H domain-containing protein [Trichonephila clavipes]